MFSFNAPQGACPECNGIGSKMEIDPDLIVPNPYLSLNEGAIAPWSKSTKRENYYFQMLQAVANHFNFSMDTPFNELPQEYQNNVLYGCKDKIAFTFKRRLVDSLETAAEFADGLINVLFTGEDGDYEKKYSEHFACVDCGINF